MADKDNNTLEVIGAKVGDTIEYMDGTGSNVWEIIREESDYFEISPSEAAAKRGGCDMFYPKDMGIWSIKKPQMEIIGYVPINEKGEPHRTNRRGGWDRKAGKNPPRIYTTEALAKKYSPVQQAKGVYM